MNRERKSFVTASCLCIIAVFMMILTACLHPADASAQVPEGESAGTVESMPEDTPSEETMASPPDTVDTTSVAPLTEEAFKSAVADPWEAFFPPPDSRFDWLQLTSGEWLKGEIKGLYNSKLEFDSDELDTLSFDWDDVKVLRSAGPQAVRYSELTEEDSEPFSAFSKFTLARDSEPLTAFGKLTLIGDTATIGTSPDATTIKRDQIITIAKGTQIEADFWSGKLSIGANIRSGNSDVTDVDVTFLAERRKAESRFHADYRGTFSRSDGVETQNNHRLVSYFDNFRSSKTYWRILFAEYFRDRFQNIQNQLTVGTGLGYDITRTKKTEWTITAGVGALYKESVSVEADKSAGNTSPALIFGTLFDTEVTDRLDYLLNYNLRVVDQQNGSLIQNIVTTLSSDITGNLDLELTLTWDRVEDPQPASDGTVPDKDDFRLTVSVAYEF